MDIEELQKIVGAVEYELPIPILLNKSANAWIIWIVDSVTVGEPGTGIPS